MFITAEPRNIAAGSNFGRRPAMLSENLSGFPYTPLSSSWGYLIRRGVKLTTHLQLVPRLRIRGAIPPLHHTYAWR